MTPKDLLFNRIEVFESLVQRFDDFLINFGLWHDAKTFAIHDFEQEILRL
jgi:hypothetical protein